MALVLIELCMPQRCTIGGSRNAAASVVLAGGILPLVPVAQHQTPSLPAPYGDAAAGKPMRKLLTYSCIFC